jgi:energy-coupling factor transport system substrate-specific component
MPVTKQSPSGAPSGHAPKGLADLFRSWTIQEIVIVVVLAAALGVLWWGWTLVDALASPLLKPLNLGYLSAGFWFTGGTLIPFLVRRPGAALIGEIVAAGIEGLITQWGITALLWGAVQGLGAELVFLVLFRYRRWDLLSLVLAGVVSGVFSWALDFVYSQYIALAPWIWGFQVVSVAVSGALLAGALSWYVGKGIIRTGALRSVLPNASA